MASEFDFSVSLAGFQSQARESLGFIQEGLLAVEREEAEEETFSQLEQQAHDIQESAQRLGLADLGEGAGALEEGVRRLGSGELGPQGFDALLGLHATLRDAVDRILENERKDIDTAYWRRGMEGQERGSPSKGSEVPVAQLAGEKASERASVTAVEMGSLANLADLPPGNGAASPRQDAHHSNSLCVSTDWLERLSENVAGLTQDRAAQEDRRAELERIQASMRALQQQWERLETRLPRDGPLGEQRARLSRQLETLAPQVHQFQRSTDSDKRARDALYNELHQCVRDLRVSSLGALLAALPQSARALAQRFQKRVEITVGDSEIELERVEGDALFESLVDLVSHTISHSIEAPEERRAVGKEPVGHLRIDAEPAGEELILSVSDDGRGLGMNAVQETIQRISGSVHVASEAGKGATLTLTVPFPRAPDLLATDRDD